MSNAAIAACLALLFAGGACHRERAATEAGAAAMPVSTDADALMKLLQLPAKPIEVWWQETAVGAQGGLGPSDHDLRVVMRFDKNVVDAIAKAAPTLPGDPARLSSAADLPWLPPPVRAALTHLDDHSIAVRGQKFDAAPLLKAPLSTGAFVVIDGGEYIFLSARTD